MLKPKRSSDSEGPRPVLLDDKPIEDQLRLKDRALAVSAEGITIADATQPDCPLIYVNQGFENLTGYSARQACGTNCRFLQGEDSDPAAIETIRRAIREKRECVVEILNYRKDGQPFWNRLSITPIRDNSGEVTHFIGIQSDVTARRQAEDALRAAKVRLEQTNNMIHRDLQLAAQIQMSFLPPRAPRFHGAEAAWELFPCDELAGDTLNVAGLDGRYIVFYVVDVSGHGVQAALLSVTLNHWLSPKSGRIINAANDNVSSEQWYILSPVEVMEHLNKQFPFDPKIGQYFTLVYGVLDTHTNEFRFAAAGHPPPVYIPAGGEPKIESSENFPIGVVPKPDFKENKIRMKKGDRIYLYSDGVIDAVNGLDERFGMEHLLDQLRVTKTDSLDTGLSSLVNRLREWTGDTSFQDDVSLLGFEIT